MKQEVDFKSIQPLSINKHKVLDYFRHFYQHIYIMIYIYILYDVYFNKYDLFYDYAIGIYQESEIH